MTSEDPRPVSEAPEPATETEEREQEAAQALRPVGRGREEHPPTEARITLADLEKHEGIQTFISLADRYLGEIGYTEHGFRHAGLVAKISFNVLSRLGYEERTAELGSLAGYLHDMGNFVSRSMHSQTGAAITYDLLKDMGMSYGEIGVVMGAIGNHEEAIGQPVNVVGAALIVADKSDVHRSRVRVKDPTKFDIHDRVNHAVEHSFLRVDAEARTLTLELEIDTELAGVMEYFEIFLSRMVMCRRAAEFLECEFKIDINGTRLL